MFFKNGSMIEKRSDVTTSGGTETLVASSSTYIRFTGTSAHTLKLPDGTTMPNGRAFKVKNDSTGEITVQDNGSNVIDTIPAGESKVIMLFSNATANGDWDLSVGGGGATPLSEEESAQFDAAGARGFSAQSRVLKFNPEEVGGNFWAIRASVPVAKCWPSNFLLNGYVYNAFGISNAPVNTATNERYHIDNNYFLSRATGITIANTRAPFVLGGKAYVAGGDPLASVLNAVEAYDDSLNSWASRTAAPGSSFYGASSWVLNDLGYVAAGQGSGTTTYAYSAVNNAWYVRTPVPTSTTRTGQGDGTYEGFGYIVSGTAVTTFRKYDPTLNSYSSEPSMAIGHAMGGVSAVNGCFIASGGENISGTPITTVEKYFSGSRSWLTVAPNSQARYGCGPAVAGQFMHISNGVGTGVAYTTVESYISSSLFSLGSLKKSTEVPASISIAVLLNGLTPNVPVQLRTDGDAWKSFMSAGDVLKLDETLSTKFKETGLPYVAGGSLADLATPNSANQFYNSSANTWINRQSLTVATHYQNQFTPNANGMFFGGVTGTIPGQVAATSGYKYDDLTNVWSALLNITVNVLEGAGFDIDGYGFVASGTTSTATANANGVTNNYRYDVTGNSWLLKTAITNARIQPAGYTHNGRGYVSGGYNTAGATQTTHYQYNSITDAWTLAGSLSTARYAPIGSSASGFGYVVSGGGTTSVEKFNDATGAFSTVASSGNTHDNGAGFRYENFIYACGGSGGGAVLSERYNPDSNVWAGITSLNSGAYTGAGNVSGNYRNYEVRVGIPAYYAGVGSYVWVSTASLTEVKSLGNGFNLGGFGLYGGGDDSVSSSLSRTELFDPATNSSVRSFPLNTARARCGNFVLNGFAHFGGTGGASPSNLSEKFSTLTGATNIANLLTSVRGMAAGFALGGYGYVACGDDNVGGWYASAERYDSSANSWLSRASVSTARGYTMNCGTSVGGFGFVASGYNGSPLTNADRYNDVTNAWTAITNVPSARYSATVLNFGDGFSVVGGTTGSIVDTVQQYNHISNSWITSNSTGLPRTGSATYTIGDEGYLAGGNNGGTFYNTIIKRSESVKQAVLSAGLTVS